MLCANERVVALNKIADAAANVFRVMVQSPVHLMENWLETFWFTALCQIDQV
jgi:hypothetical protein